MENGENESLNIVLDIQDTALSLNPFHRPPNMLIDDDLNRVTQEELEANLSTDCPIREGIPSGHKTNDMWEQLIQSVLEDNSTQDIVEGEDALNAMPSAIEDTKQAFVTVYTADPEINNTPSIPLVNEKVFSSSLTNTEKVRDRLIDPVGVKCFCATDEIAKIEEVCTSPKHNKSPLSHNVGDNGDNIADGNELNGKFNPHTSVSTSPIASAISSFCDELNDAKDVDFFAESDVIDDVLQRQLRNIMNDHCYVLRQPEISKDCIKSDLKQNLIDHLKLKVSYDVKHDELILLVHKLLEESNEHIIGKLLNVFEQNGSNSLYDDDDKSNIDKEEQLTDKLNTTNDVKDIKTDVSEISVQSPLQNLNVKNSDSNSLPAALTNDFDMEINESNKISNGNHLSAACSEYLKDDLTDNRCIIPAIKPLNFNSELVELLAKLNDFALNLQKGCTAFDICSASSSIDSDIHNYIKEQYENYLQTFRSYCISSHDVEVQADSKYTSKYHRNKLNMKSKKKLLNSSDSSIKTSASSLSSSSSSSDDSDSINSTESLLLSGNHSPLSAKMEHSNLQLINKCNKSDKLRHVSLSSSDDKLQESTFAKECSTRLSSDKDDEEKVQQVDNNQFKPDEKMENDDSRSSHSESDKENKGKLPLESDAEIDKTDKEIERLINLEGLNKRSVYTGNSSKTKENSKTKVLTSKSVSEAFDAIDGDVASDDSKGEPLDEVITEKQFLIRCNEDIKNEMLNETSSDDGDDHDESTLDEEDDDLLSLSSDISDSGKESPLVEKFLKTYTLEKDDIEDDVEDDDGVEDAVNENDVSDDLVAATNKEEQSGDNSTETIDNESDKERKKKKNDGDDDRDDDDDEIVEVKSKKNDDDSVNSSDIELLNDNLLHSKNTSTSKRKLTAPTHTETEQRKKNTRAGDELISVSSDSSDVEAIEEEEKEDKEDNKPRSLKAMLRPDQLASETIKAQKMENERITRLEKKTTALNKILKEHPDVNKEKDLILDYNKETKIFIKVHPDLVQCMKPHQNDGVRFMYDSCYGGVEALKKHSGSGCILAHCMGLGKTLQLIALLHTLISYKELKTTKILVLSPKSTVMNWADEIIRWLGPLRQKNLKVYTFNDTSDINEKLSILREWSLSDSNRAGCLLMGYEAYRSLIFYHSYKKRVNVNAAQLEQIRKNINSYLLDPGSDLVVCDEGHIIKNNKSAISLAVAKIKTPRRIILTGTPIQNNLKEYYSMVNFIKPLFLGTEKEFANLYANPIRNGQHKDSGKTDIKIMKQRSFVLHKKLSKFVQRKEAELLKTFLPPKFEYVLFIPMTDVQNNLYTYILKTIANREDNHRGRGLITDYTCLRKIWTHPKVLENAWKNAINQKNKRDKDTKIKNHSDDDQPDDIYDSQTGQMSVINDWWRHLLSENDLESIMPSNKLRTMFHILQMCEEKGEKCLIFSAFVAVLNVVEYFFKKITEKDPEIMETLNMNPNTNIQWILGEDYYRLDGKTAKSIRHEMINVFNSVLNKRARVFLISAKAGGQGINLIGANRVIILDTSWNPSNDQQNIFRVFRLGQKRNCYIYRLLAMGTMEEKVYSRSVTKQAMSFRVVDEQQIDRHYSMAELAELYTLTKPDYGNRPTPILPQDSILARLLRSFPDLVFKYHEHDSLLENKVEQELSEQEKNEAWAAYERDLQMNSEVREPPNLEDFQNNIFLPKLQNYISPFAGVDMGAMFNYRSFAPTFLPSLMGQNNNAVTATQQYLDFYNYYKNLSSNYSDMNYTTPLTQNANVMNRFPNTGPATAVVNPLAALGDLSMLGSTGLTNPNLSHTSAALGLSKNNLPNLMQSSLSNPSLYNSSILGGNMPAANNLVGNNGASSLLSAYEQYTQSLRGPYANMYNYASDFGLGMSGSTILDKSKSNASGKMNHLSAMPTSMKTPPTNLGGVSVNDALSMYSSPISVSSYTNQRSKNMGRSNNNTHNNAEQLTNAAIQNFINETEAKRYSSQSDPMDELKKYKSNEFGNMISSKLANQRNFDNRDKIINQNSNTKQMSSSSSFKTSPLAHSTAAATSSTPPNIISSSGNLGMSASMAVRSDVHKSNHRSHIPIIPPIHNNNAAASTTSAAGGIGKSDTFSTTPINTTTTATKMDMLFSNNKNSAISLIQSHANSSVNMGIVYPQVKSSSKVSSEMQIIPTSSPPGTTSLSKQLNHLSPSISLTAVNSSNTTQQQHNRYREQQHSLNNNHIGQTKATSSSASKASSMLSSSVGSVAPNTSLVKLPSSSNAKKSLDDIQTSSPDVAYVSSMPGTLADSIAASVKKLMPINQMNRSGLTITSAKSTSNNNIIAGSNSAKSSNHNSITLVKQNPTETVYAKTANSNATNANVSITRSGVTLTPNSKNSPNTRSPTLSSSPIPLSTIKKSLMDKVSLTSANTNKFLPLSTSAALNSNNTNISIYNNNNNNNNPTKSFGIASTTLNRASPLPRPSSNPSVITISKNLKHKHLPASSSITSASSTTASSSASTSALALASTASPALSPPSLSLPTAPTAGSVNTVRNTVNIRPLDERRSLGSGNSAYIIETNINDKKLAIGAPTRSGGGTTVTKILNPMKRRTSENSSKTSPADIKRFKE